MTIKFVELSLFCSGNNIDRSGRVNNANQKTIQLARKATKQLLGSHISELWTRHDLIKTHLPDLILALSDTLCGRTSSLTLSTPEGTSYNIQLESIHLKNEVAGMLAKVTLRSLRRLVRGNKKLH